MKYLLELQTDKSDVRDVLKKVFCVCKKKKCGLRMNQNNIVHFERIKKAIER